MIVIFKPEATPRQIESMCKEFTSRGLRIHASEGEHTHLVGLVGDTSAVDIDWVRANPAVAEIRRVSEPYKQANRKFHPKDTCVEVAGVPIGGGHFAVMAGPCIV